MGVEGKEMQLMRSEAWRVQVTSQVAIKTEDGVISQEQPLPTPDPEPPKDRRHQCVCVCVWVLGGTRTCT